LQSIKQLPQADRRAVLPNFDVDLAAVVGVATETADDTADDVDVATETADDATDYVDDGYCILVPDAPLDNVLIVNAADARHPAFQVTRTPLHRRKKIGMRQLEHYLDATGATAARPLKR